MNNLDLIDKMISSGTSYQEIEVFARQNGIHLSNKTKIQISLSNKLNTFFSDFNKIPENEKLGTKSLEEFLWFIDQLTNEELSYLTDDIFQKFRTRLLII